MAASYITERADNEANSDARQILSSIKDLHQRKLWHQLTENVKKAVTMESVSDKCGLYTRFLKEFEDKLNAVSLVQVVITAARAELSHSPADALAFISPLLSENATKTVAADIEAKVLLLSEVAELHLRAEDTASCKTNIRSAREIVDAGHELSAAVHAAFYRAAAEYHKVVGSAADFFRAALQFLAYTPPDALDLAAQRQWAFDLGIAALVGADVYNFSELLAHNVVRSLEGSAHAWLLRLLNAFHDGDLKKFDEVCESATQEMNAQPALVAHPEFLRQKVTILALMQLATTKSGTRIISFAEVREVCRLPEEEVEFLLMRAMSLGLITGVIDNVAEEVAISRVQPRVVDRECVAEMAKRLEAWCGNVDETLNSVSRGAITIGE